MQTVSVGDNLHKMPNPVYRDILPITVKKKKQKKNTYGYFREMFLFHHENVCYGDIILYLAVMHRDFSVIFYNSQCIISQGRNCFYRLLPALSHCVLMSSAAKRDINRPNEIRYHNVIKMFTLRHYITSILLMNGLNKAIFLRC